MSDEVAFIFVLVAVVILAASIIGGVRQFIDRGNIREQCEAVGGVYVSQRYDTPLCLDSSTVVIP